MSEESKNQVVVVDIKMPFSSMVIFMVKWAIAAIPAIIILTAFFFVSSAAIYGTVLGYISSKSPEHTSEIQKESTSNPLSVVLNEKVTASLKSNDGSHYIQVPRLELMASDSKSAIVLRENTSKISDAIFTVLQSKSIKEMLEPGSDKALANDLKEAINNSLGLTESSGVVEVIGASSFIVQ